MLPSRPSPRLARPCRALVVALLSLPLAARASHAQDTSATHRLAAALRAVPAGTAVRLRTRSLPRHVLVGALEGEGTGAVRLRVDDGHIVGIVLEELVDVERYAGRRPAGMAVARGALGGLAIGAAVSTAAMLLAARTERRDACSSCDVTPTEFVGAMSVAFTIATTGIGASTGLSRRDRWVRVWPLPR